MTLTAVYDLAEGPVSYDFVTWLVRAMKERDDRGLEGLHVVICPKEDGLGGFSRNWGKHDEHAARWRLWHIVVASCPLAGATVTLAESRRQAQQIAEASGRAWWPEGKAHLMGPLVQAARKGEAIPKLRATEAARRHVAKWFTDNERIVTLTLRNQTTDPDRNSNVHAWGEFSVWLKDQNFRPVVLNETTAVLDRYMEKLAAVDPDLRLALYEIAAMNVIGNNGPQELLKFSDSPYIIMGLALSDGWKDHFRKYFHMEPGEQLPWAAPNQRLVYKSDTFENLKEEFERSVSVTSSS